ncbi:MAG TPA: methylated-DNA--[protein]-cysteine S-methyltransferase [Acidimicrobiales bacterium]|jgi:methylated-DNA-[protein]-cysteine S-methyltransferase|nr:methylated-DNA--[protein]-cysteine S-methyltransferase [Acidimicrobiales bacterium]
MNMQTIAVATMQTPIGPFTIAVDAGVTCAAGFVREPELLMRQLDAARRLRPLRPRGDVGAVTDAVHAYFAGDFDALEQVDVEQPGTAVQHEVWRALREVPAQKTTTYTELAARIGRPTAARVVGNACGRNHVALIVPCHRALRSDGGLGGYAYGTDLKAWLLRHEGSVHQL